MAVSDRSTAPTVSIVIPMYNAEPFIGKMIDCILAQTYSDWELLVVDDGSTDTGKRIVAEYAAKDPRIKLMARSEERTKGGNTCRNIGLENAAGEYVVFFDADDLIAPYCLEQRVDFISRHPELDFAIFPLTAFKQEPFDVGCIALGYKNSRHALSKLIRNLVPFQVVTNIYRKDSLLSRGIVWDEQLRSHQDPDFNILCLRSGMKFSESNLLPDYFWRIAAPQLHRKEDLHPGTFQNQSVFFRQAGPGILGRSTAHGRFADTLRLPLQSVGIPEQSAIRRNVPVTRIFRPVCFPQTKAALHRTNAEPS